MYTVNCYDDPYIYRQLWQTLIKADITSGQFQNKAHSSVLVEKLKEF